MADASILIVEDDALASLELKETLEKFGYRVPAAVKRGEDVPEAIVVNKPDLILMDIRLKGFQDGIETAYIVGGEFEIPFVFLSAYSDDETLSRALGTRAYGYLVKPFEEKTLKTTIALALKRSREFRERDHEDWYRSVLARFPRPVLLTDVYGRITFANDAVRSRFAAEATSKVGSAVHLLFGDPAAVTDLLAVAGRLPPGQAAAKGVLGLREGGGEAELDVGPLRGEDGRVSGYVVLFGAA